MRETRVLREHAGGVARLGQLPLGLAAGQLVSAHVEIDGVGNRVDHDAIAFPDERDRAAVDGLGRDVADTEAVRAAGESAVGDERAVAAPSGTLHRAGDGEHLAHTRAALRPFVPDHDDIAREDRPGEDRLHRAVFAFEDPCGPFEPIEVDARDLHDRTLGRHRSPENRDATARVDRVAERMNDISVG